MATLTTFFYTHLLLFLLSLTTLSLKCVSWSPQREIDYHKWVSWNAENHRTKTMTLGTKTIVVTGKKVLDEELRKAELNKVKIGVSQDGSSDFKTIKEAIQSIPLKNTKRVILEIKSGVYREKIVIPKTLPFITFLGDSENLPIITWNDSASSVLMGEFRRTFDTATVVVAANYFVAINIKFENTALHDVGSKGQQAVALRTSGNKTAFYNCSFYGYQDTLYDHSGLHYFNNCFIEGAVDFIFGYGRSFYENCHLNSISKKVSFITAQKKSNMSMSSGFSFKDCVITGSGSMYLGRAWGEYSTVIFSNTFMEKLILPEGWNNWGDEKRQTTVYYGEYNCSGPGANLNGRVAWARALTDEEAKPFMGTYYVYGDTWLLEP